MGQEENLRATTTKGALEAVFERCDGVTYVVNPWADMLQTIAEVGRSFDGEFPTLRVFAAEEPLRTARIDFTLGSKLADLGGAGSAAFRPGDVPGN